MSTLIFPDHQGTYVTTNAEEILLPHIEEIRDDLAAGRTTYAAIGRRYGVSLEAVSRFVINQKLPRRSVGRLPGSSTHQPSPERIHLQNECLRLARDGWSAARIAASLNPPRTREMVRLLLKDAGHKGLWRLVAEDRAAIARLIAPLLAAGKTRLQIATEVKDHDITLNEIDAVLSMARNRHYEDCDRRQNPSHAYLDDVCAAMEILRDALHSGKSARHTQAALEKKIFTFRQRIVRTAVSQARKSGHTMSTVANLAHLAYSSLAAMISGSRGVTRDTWSKLSTALPEIAKTPYPEAPPGSEDLDEDSGLRPVDETPPSNPKLPPASN